MALTKITKRGDAGAPFTIWQASTEADITLANGFWPDPGDVVVVLSTGGRLMCVEGGGFVWLGGTAPVPPALVASVAQGSTNGNGFTSAAINTTGATLLVAAISYTGGTQPTLTDSNSNTWTALTSFASGSNHVLLLYTTNPTVGSGHTFTVAQNSSYATLSVAAFSGTQNVAPDINTGQGSGSASVVIANATPAHDNELIVTAYVSAGGLSATVSSPFTILGQTGFTSGQHEAGGIAYAVQTLAQSIGATWAESGGSTMAGAMASFRAVGS